MSTFTPNYNLEKPDNTDEFKDFRQSYNDNMDKIDQNMGGGGGSSVSWSQLQVTGDKIATIRVSGINTDVFTPNSQTFTMAVSRININSDETYPTIFGKIKKWFADLKAVAFSGSYNDLSNTPTKVSDFTNDSGFVTSTVNNLANYYLKSETYTQAQVDALIGAISTISIEVVQTLPTQDIKTNTIYLVPKQTAGTQNVYDEYIYVNNAWELIGDTEIDLSNYVTTTDLATALQDYVTSTGLSTILANYYTSSQVDTLLGGKVNDVEVNGTSVVNGQGVAEVTVPTKTSDLNNDSGYLTDSDVSVTQVVSSGTKIATIDVYGTSTDLYAPASGGGSVNDVTVNGTSVVNAQGVAEVTAVQDNPTFTEASTRANIASGESFATILGKIKKFFTDLKTVAFSGSYNDLSDKPTIPDISTKVSKSGDTMSGNLTIDRQNGSTSTLGYSIAILGNNIAYGTDKNSEGVVRLYGTDSTATDITATSTAQRYINFPDKNGTVALTSDIPTNNNQLTNGAGYITSSGSCASATKATQDVDGNDINQKYVNVYNSNNVMGSASVSVNDMAKAGFCMGMVKGSTDNPTGSSKWVHIISLPWSKGDNTSWVSQIAMNPNDSDGMWYRTGQGTIVGRAWKRIIDSSNIGSQSVSYATSAGSATDSTKLPLTGGTMTGKITCNADRILQWTNNDSDLNPDGASWYGLTKFLSSEYSSQPNRKSICLSCYWGVSLWAKDGAHVTANGYPIITTNGGTIENDLTISGNILYLLDSLLMFKDAITGKTYAIHRPTGSLSTNRDVYFPNKGGTIAFTSDISSRRYKENIIPLSEDEAKKILDVEIVNYDYKENVVDDEERYDQKGAIAEDVVNIIPNAVTYADIDGEQLPDGINYTKFIPYLIKMVQMQQKEIEELKELIKAKGE